MPNPVALQLQGISERAEAQLAAALARLHEAGMSYVTVPDLVAALVEAGATESARLVARYTAAEALIATGELPPIPARGELVSKDKVRLAAETIIAAADESVDMRLQRLARSAVARAGQHAGREMIKKSSTITGWTRGIDSDSCQLCKWWSRDGQVWPKTHHMPTHAGCTCVQVPAFGKVSTLDRRTIEQSELRKDRDRRTNTKTSQ